MARYGPLYLSQHPDADNEQAPRFSTTQQWYPELRARVGQFSGWITAEDFAQISIPPCPPMLSPLTSAEIEYLRELKEIRDPEVLASIRREATLSGFWAPRFITERGVNRFPATEGMIIMMMAEIEPIVMTLKARCDRVRPHILDPRLEPVLEVPGHPAYPSGHGTQSHILAYLYSELDPANTAEYLERAAEITWHREVAGLHYPSDGLCGKILARQIVDLLWTKPQFKALYAAVEKEWATRRLKNSKARRFRVALRAAL